MLDHARSRIGGTNEQATPVPLVSHAGNRFESTIEVLDNCIGSALAVHAQLRQSRSIDMGFISFSHRCSDWRLIIFRCPAADRRCARPEYESEPREN